jgi:2-polyprenyl-6-methoxyphenol hydroxylase-like FAD-dependent oxidoreductase
VVPLARRAGAAAASTGPQPGQGYGLVWSVPDDARPDELMACRCGLRGRADADATGGAGRRAALASERAQLAAGAGAGRAVVRPGLGAGGRRRHLVHPLAGQGLNLGLADVAELAEVLAAASPGAAWATRSCCAATPAARLLPTRAMAS